MAVSFKHSSILLIIFFGLFIFISNSLKLNLNKNRLFELNNNEDNINIINENQILTQKNIKKFDKVDNKIPTNQEQIYNEILIIVKKGETFSKILDNISLKNEKKFQIIDSINKLFNLKKLNVGQKISFYLDNNKLIKKIKIELDFKTDLIVKIDKAIKAQIIQLDTVYNNDSKEFLITNSLLVPNQAQHT